MLQPRHLSARELRTLRLAREALRVRIIVDLHKVVTKGGEFGSTPAITSTTQLAVGVVFRALSLLGKLDRKVIAAPLASSHALAAVVKALASPAAFLGELQNFEALLEGGTLSSSSVKAAQALLLSTAPAAAAAPAHPSTEPLLSWLVAAVRCADASAGLGSFDEAPKAQGLSKAVELADLLDAIDELADESIDSKLVTESMDVTFDSSFSQEGEKCRVIEHEETSATIDSSRIEWGAKTNVDLNLLGTGAEEACHMQNESSAAAYGSCDSATLARDAVSHTMTLAHPMLLPRHLSSNELRSLRIAREAVRVRSLADLNKVITKAGGFGSKPAVTSTTQVAVGAAFLALSLSGKLDRKVRIASPTSPHALMAVLNALAAPAALVAGLQNFEALLESGALASSSVKAAHLFLHHMLPAAGAAPAHPSTEPLLSWLAAAVRCADASADLGSFDEAPNAQRSSHAIDELQDRSIDSTLVTESMEVTFDTSFSHEEEKCGVIEHEETSATKDSSRIEWGAESNLDLNLLGTGAEEACHMPNESAAAAYGSIDSAMLARDAVSHTMTFAYPMLQPRHLSSKELRSLRIAREALRVRILADLNKVITKAGEFGSTPAVTSTTQVAVGAAFLALSLSGKLDRKVRSASPRSPHALIAVLNALSAPAAFVVGLQNFEALLESGGLSSSSVKAAHAFLLHTLPAAGAAPAHPSTEPLLCWLIAAVRCADAEADLEKFDNALDAQDFSKVLKLREFLDEDASANSTFAAESLHITLGTTFATEENDSALVEDKGGFAPLESKDSSVDCNEKGRLAPNLFRTSGEEACHMQSEPAFAAHALGDLARTTRDAASHAGGFALPNLPPRHLSSKELRSLRLAREALRVRSLADLKKVLTKAGEFGSTPAVTSATHLAVGAVLRALSLAGKLDRKVRMESATSPHALVAVLKALAAPGTFVAVLQNFEALLESGGLSRSSVKAAQTFLARTAPMAAAPPAHPSTEPLLCWLIAAVRCADSEADLGSFDKAPDIMGSSKSGDFVDLLDAMDELVDASVEPNLVTETMDISFECSCFSEKEKPKLVDHQDCFALAKSDDSSVESNIEGGFSPNWFGIGAEELSQMQNESVSAADSSGDLNTLASDDEVFASMGTTKRLHASVATAQLHFSLGVASLADATLIKWTVDAAVEHGNIDKSNNEEMSAHADPGCRAEDEFASNSVNENTKAILVSSLDAGIQSDFNFVRGGIARVRNEDSVAHLQSKILDREPHQTFGALALKPNANDDVFECNNDSVSVNINGGGEAANSAPSSDDPMAPKYSQDCKYLLGVEQHDSSSAVERGACETTTIGKEGGVAAFVSHTTRHRGTQNHDSFTSNEDREPGVECDLTTNFAKTLVTNVAAEHCKSQDDSAFPIDDSCSLGRAHRDAEMFDALVATERLRASASAIHSILNEGGDSVVVPEQAEGNRFEALEHGCLDQLGNESAAAHACEARQIKDESATEIVDECDVANADIDEPVDSFKRFVEAIEYNRSLRAEDKCGESPLEDVVQLNTEAVCSVVEEKCQAKGNLIFKSDRRDEFLDSDKDDDSMHVIGGGGGVNVHKSEDSLGSEQLLGSNVAFVEQNASLLALTSMACAASLSGQESRVVVTSSHASAGQAQKNQQACASSDGMDFLVKCDVASTFANNLFVKDSESFCQTQNDSRSCAHASYSLASDFDALVATEQVYPLAAAPQLHLSVGCDASVSVAEAIEDDRSEEMKHGCLDQSDIEAADAFLQEVPKDEFATGVDHGHVDVDSSIARVKRDDDFSDVNPSSRAEEESSEDLLPDAMSRSALETLQTIREYAWEYGIGNEPMDGEKDDGTGKGDGVGDVVNVHHENALVKREDTFGYEHLVGSNVVGFEQNDSLVAVSTGECQANATRIQSHGVVSHALAQSIVQDCVANSTPHSFRMAPAATALLVVNTLFIILLLYMNTLLSRGSLQ